MEIHLYAEAGNLKGLSRLISEGVPVDSPRKDDSFTPLVCGIISPDADIEHARNMHQPNTVALAKPTRN